ncbi:MAG: hypothetical protein QM791_09140 [Ferruginibacter sp.]
MKKIMPCIFLLFFNKSHAQTVNDSVAIVRILEKESATWRSGDMSAHAACWSIKPYSRILISTGDGKTLDVPPALMVNPPAGLMGKGGTSANSNYKMNVSNNTAWVSHDEISTSADGNQTYSYEFRMLEKIEGEWKLVGQSIHIYKKE